MNSFWSLSKKYPSFRQVGLITCFVTSCFAQAQVTRAPASYIPDDDVIVKPIENEISFYQRFVKSDNSDEVQVSRNQIKVWNDNQIFADQYGMDSSLTGSAFFVPTQEEKFEYFKERYMRYLRRRGEQPFKDMPKEWYSDFREDLRASNEVDNINELEERFQKTNKTTSTGQTLPKALQERELKLSKKIKFIFQPRLDQGLVIAGFKTPWGKARAWVGANGQTEVNVKQDFNSIGLRVMYNYYTDTGRYLSSVDQRLAPGVYARFTSQKDPARVTRLNRTGENNIVMLLYVTRF